MHKPKAFVVWVAMRTGAFGSLFARIAFAIFPSWRSK